MLVTLTCGLNPHLVVINGAYNIKVCTEVTKCKI